MFLKIYSVHVQLCLLLVCFTECRFGYGLSDEHREIMKEEEKIWVFLCDKTTRSLYRLGDNNMAWMLHVNILIIKFFKVTVLSYKYTTYSCVPCDIYKCNKFCLFIDNLTWKKKLVIKDSFLTCTVSFQSQASNTQGRRPDHHFVKQTEKIIWHSLHRVLNIDKYHANLQL